MRYIDVRERSTTAVTRAESVELEQSESFGNLLAGGIISLIRSRSTPYGIRASSFVGEALVASDVQLRIEEKSPGAARALLRWSVPEDLRRLDANSPAAVGGEILETFAERFLEHLGYYLRRGRLKEYRRTTEISLLPRGKLDVSGTAKLRGLGRVQQIAQYRQTLTADLMANRLVGSALEAVERIFAARAAFAELVVKARTYALLFQDIDPSPVRRSAYLRRKGMFDAVLLDRAIMAELRSAIIFARPLALHFGLWEPGAEDQLPDAYFLNLETLFEDAVSLATQELLDSTKYKAISGLSMKRPLFQDISDRYIADPDIVILGDAAPIIVADCKYKDLESFPAHSDIYQLLSHCAAFGSNIGVLIYPGDIRSRARVGSSVMGIEVWRLTVRPQYLLEDITWSLVSFGLAIAPNESACPEVIV